MQNSSSNTILHNTLANNTLQLVSINSTSSLDDGIEGNYWSDYNGTDEDQDGIGNTPYVIDGNNMDNHPLMGAFSEFTITREKQTYYINAISNSTISNFNFSLTEYTARFNVNSPVNASGFCRIMIPEILIMGPYITLIDNKKVNTTLLMVSNATQTFMYFAYSPGTHEVTISSEPFYQLLEKYGNLLAAYQNLTSTYNQLFGNYTSLQGINDALSRQYESLNSTYQNLSDSYNELESKYNTASNEIANIKNQIPIFTVATIMETIAVLALISLGIRYNNMLSKQKKEIEAYKRQLEKVSHLEGARAGFAEDVRRRKAKIEQFEKKYHVIIRPPSTLEEIFESMKLKEKTSKEA
jgi:DNA repair exonuclease SbcCD ATPase subunit